MHPFSKKLISWYHTNKRTLPWRDTVDPYKIWLSEVILQQTRVEQGLPYYNKFIEKYPTVKSMAIASQDEILKLWQGLGYYSRARNLHESAKQILDVYDGQFPNNYEKLLKLKGVGTYTAAAIASFAFNLPHAVLDGNVYRVLSRLFNIHEPINSHQAKSIFTQIASDLLPSKHASDFNQAIMEFGALHCKPTSPLCATCPLNKECLALIQNTVSVLPFKTAKKPVQKRYINYLYISDEQRIWLHQRVNQDIWKNLYDLPYIETESKIELHELQNRLDFIELFKKKSYNIVSQKTMVHKLTHREIHATFWQIDVKKDFILNKNGIFETSFHLLNNFAVSRLLDKYFEGIAKKDKNE